MSEHVCTGPMCLPCVEEQLYAGVFAPRDDEDAAIDAGLERAAEDILREADAEIERAKANGTDYYPERQE